jgi:hypothetical protein
MADLKGNTMTLTIDFAPDEVARLRQRATQEGKDLGTFIHHAAMETVDRPSLAEVLSPIHEGTAQIGATVEEIDQMADQALAEVRRERHQKGST